MVIFKDEPYYGFFSGIKTWKFAAKKDGDLLQIFLKTTFEIREAANFGKIKNAQNILSHAKLWIFRLTKAVIKPNVLE